MRADQILSRNAPLRLLRSLRGAFRKCHIFDGH